MDDPTPPFSTARAARDAAHAAVRLARAAHAALVESSGDALYLGPGAPSGLLELTLRACEAPLTLVLPGDARFAGVPVPGGGALGVVGRRPDGFDERDLAGLEEAAAAFARHREAAAARTAAPVVDDLARSFVQTLLEHFPDQLYVKDASCRFVAASRAVADRYRLDDPVRLVGRTSVEIQDGDHARRSLAAEEELLRTGVPTVGLEERETWPDGRETWVSTTKVPIRDGAGRVVGLLGVSRDVTQRKRAEEALRASERRLRLLLDQLPAIVWTTDPELHVLSALGAGLVRVGLTPSSPEVGGLLGRLADHEGSTPVAEAHRRALAGEAAAFQARVGDAVFDCSVEPLRDQDGALAGVVGLAVDVTGRHAAEEALRASEARTSAILESALDCVLTVDGGHRIVEANRAAEEVFEWDRRELVGRPLEELLPDLGRAGFGLAVGRLLETRGRRSDGSELPVELAITEVDHPGDRLLTVVVRDIAERKHAEEEVRAADAKYRTLVEGLPLVTYITVLGDELDALYVSPQIEHLTGWTPEEWLQEPGFAAAAVHPEDLPRLLADVARVEASTERLRTEYRLRHRDGRVVWVLDETVVVRDASGSPLFRQGILIDVTDRKHLEEQLAHSQKMEAVGKLAGGVAHDFNNLLTAITGYSDLLLLSLPGSDPLRLDAEQIKKAADRAAGLTRQLLAFSRRQVLSPQVLDLNDVIRGVEELLRRLIGEQIEPIVVLSSDLGTTKADPGQLEQVLVNLSVNARDAMPDGGKLLIETRNVVLDDAYAAEHVDVPPGPYVMLAVTDTGSGMDPETRSRAFEPFFTTKEPGKGTGLGLATVYGIVKQSDGHVAVYSELGHGSTFKVYLPRLDDAAAGEPPAGEEAERRGSETILLVEDETVVRSLVSKVLERNGYRVLEACQGTEALEICRSFSGQIDLMLTDVVMPGMSGSELAERIVEVRPEVKVIHMSGYTDEAIRHHGVLGQGKAFLPKPFTMETLARTVRDVLDD